ncbi:MAG: response regulator, partial [Chloroflexi bacterium]|nr:response regulator [Chloroflexota bacterium]
MSKRILVIEPSRTHRAIFVLNLRQGGHHVVIFKDYEAALAAFPRFHEQPPDLAFVALHADRPESAQALMRLRAFCLQTTLVMMITQEDSGKLLVQRIGS